MLGWISGGSAHEDDLGPETYEVRACYVIPARWRTGIGRQLIAALLDRLDPQRWKRLVLMRARTPTTTGPGRGMGESADS
jgi:GNAT superfamily N-acetyltransferase